MDWWNQLCQPVSNSYAQATQGSSSQRDSTQGDSVSGWMNCCTPSSHMTMQTGGSRSGQPERAGIGIILALSPDGSLYVHTASSPSASVALCTLLPLAHSANGVAESPCLRFWSPALPRPRGAATQHPAILSCGSPGAQNATATAHRCGTAGVSWKQLRRHSGAGGYSDEDRCVAPPAGAPPPPRVLRRHCAEWRV